ncbi:MAG: endonuclease/exonuclease/phosphatase family protein, partial [Planctomycetales bacterium]
MLRRILTSRPARNLATALFAVAAIAWITVRVLGFPGPRDLRKDPDRLTLMTLNAEFLWDGQAPEEGQVEFPWKSSPRKAVARMRALAKIIRDADADIVSLAEVENLDALRIFNQGQLRGMHYLPRFAQGIDRYTGQDMGLLTRIAPDFIRRDDRKGRSGNLRKSVSKNYVAVIRAGDRRIALIGLHFLAKPDDKERRPAREAQADAVRSMAVEQRRAGRLVVVWGDFNDYDGSPESRDAVGHVPITNVLRRVREMDPRNPDDDLINVARWLPAHRRYTSFYDRNGNGRVDPPKEFSSIDHVLISPELARHVESVEIPTGHDPTASTDHFPIVVRLNFAKSWELNDPRGDHPPSLGPRIASLL